jgi:hypothetical protein
MLFSASALLVNSVFIIRFLGRFYKLCPKWISEVKKNPQATTEFQRFSQSAWVQSVRYQPLLASAPFFAFVVGAILSCIFFLVHDLHTGGVNLNFLESDKFVKSISTILTRQIHLES